MSLIPILLAAALLVLAAAFGFHCLLVHCDKAQPTTPAHDSDSDSRRAAG
jgi:hypothetical protein